MLTVWPGQLSLCGFIFTRSRVAANSYTAHNPVTAALICWVTDVVARVHMLKAKATPFRFESVGGRLFWVDFYGQFDDTCMNQIQINLEENLSKFMWSKLVLVKRACLDCNNLLLVYQHRSLTMIFQKKNIIDDGKIITFRRSYLLLNLGRKNTSTCMLISQCWKRHLPREI
jgi:hypothetical protein